MGYSVFCVVFLISHFTSAYETVNDGDSKINLPSQSDLIKYLLPLKGVTNYCWNNENEFDINFAFGLFLTNVNLGSVYRRTRTAIPKYEKRLIRDIYSKNEELLNSFRSKIEHDFNLLDWKYRIISTLFTNSSDWMYRTNRMWARPGYNDRHDFIRYPEWQNYVMDVGNVFKWVPNPLQSDNCLMSLAYSTTLMNNIYSHCPVAKTCYRMLRSGTNFGYALSHRLLLLLMAKLGGGCSIFTRKEDNILKEMFCSLGYGEVKYIASNDYKLLDLMLEFMCLCSLDGHAEFLQSNWLNETLKFQTKYGCFSRDKRANIVKRTGRVWKLNRSRDHELLVGKCNGHTTALASSVLAAAIRYIIQTYY